MTTITIPIDVAEAAAEALGNFVSDHGWSDSDMQAMDNLDAYIARHKAIRAELAKPVGPATAPKPAAWINGHDLRLLGRQGRGALVWCDNEGNADTPLYLHPPTPAWHDAPTCGGIWLNSCDGHASVIDGDERALKNAGMAAGHWYGPIPQDKEGEKS